MDINYVPTANTTGATILTAPTYTAWQTYGMQTTSNSVTAWTPVYGVSHSFTWGDMERAADELSNVSEAWHRAVGCFSEEDTEMCDPRPVEEDSIEMAELCISDLYGEAEENNDGVV